MVGGNPFAEKTMWRIPKDSIGAELGVWKGDSSKLFLKRAKLLHLVDSWSIAPYSESDEHGNYEAYIQRYKKIVGSKDPKDFQKYYDKIYEGVVNRFKGQPVNIHRCTTTDFFERNKDLQLDWVYVDAAHSYEGCLKDLYGSLNIVKKGGFIFGDDYTNKTGVNKAVKQFVKETGLKFDNFYNNQFQIDVI